MRRDAWYFRSLLRDTLPQLSGLLAPVSVELSYLQKLSIDEP
jgi:hypothetical protein